MKILIINWRSITDPLKGGAEIVTFEHARRWVKNHNAQITWICAKYNKDLNFENLEGINFKYLGKELKRDSTLNLFFSFPLFFYLAYKEYQDNFKNNVDVVIDQIHGIPFLTPLYVKEKVILYIHEVAGNIWDKMFPFPINIIGKFLEKNLLNLYKDNKIITVSNSTKEDLLSIHNFKNITIVHNGVNLKPLEKPLTKFENFTLVFLNRIVKMKGPERAIEIFSEVKKIIPNSKLVLIGNGEKDYLEELNIIVKKLNLYESVNILGFVPEEEKLNYLRKSHVLINTSFKEGWGLVNIEANTQGTAAVAFDVEGCRDSIKNGINGYISKDSKEFVSNILKIKENNLAKESLEYSKEFNWDLKAEEFYQQL